MPERSREIVHRTGLLGLLLVGALAFALAACGDDGGATASAAEPTAVAAAEADAHDEADAHEDADAGAHEDADAGAHEDANADAHEGAEDGEANAHLEVAPKDALFLVEMSSFAFTPAVLEVKVGDVIEIAIQNIDPILHDFTIDKIDADLHISYLGGSGEHAHDADMAMEMVEPDLHFPLSEPGSGVVHLQVHEPGEYVFYCSVPGHRELGMVGTLIVR